MIRKLKEFFVSAVGSFSWAPPAWVEKLKRRFARQIGVLGSELSWRELAGKLAAKLREKSAAGLAWCRVQARKDPKRFWAGTAAAVLAPVLCVAGLRWYAHLPKRVKFPVSGTSPVATKQESSYPRRMALGLGPAADQQFDVRVDIIYHLKSATIGNDRQRL